MLIFSFFFVETFRLVVVIVVHVVEALVFVCLNICICMCVCVVKFIIITLIIFFVSYFCSYKLLDIKTGHCSLNLLLNFTEKCGTDVVLQRWHTKNRLCSGL